MSHCTSCCSMSVQQVRHNTLPRHGETDLRFMRVSISKDSNNTLGISIVEAKLTSSSVSETFGKPVR